MRAVLRFYHDAYSGLPTTVWWLCAIAFVNRAGTMVVPFLTLWLTEELGFSLAEAGTLIACFGAGSMAGSWVGGWLTDRCGALGVQAASLVLGGVCFVVLGTLREFTALAIALAALGVIGDAFRPANLALLASNAPAAVRSKSFALLRLALNLGWAIGPTVGGFLAKVDYAYLFWIDGATGALAGALLVATRGRFRSVAAEAGDTPAHAARGPLRDATFLGVMALALAVAVVFMQFLFLAPLHQSRAWNLDEREIGILSGLNAVLIIALEMVLTHGLRHHRPLRLVALGGLLTGLGFGMNGIATGAAGGALAIVVWTFGEMLESPALMSWTAARAGAARRGSYMAIVSLVYSVAFMIAPLAGAAAYDGLGPRMTWFGCAVLGGVAAAGIVMIDRRDVARTG